MEIFLPYLPHFTAMAVLIAASAVFSCSEAALFYLRREQRERMAGGSVGARTAVRLLNKPERLLTAILFWNLVINMAYFALASVIGIGLTKSGAAREASLLTIGALLAVIVFCEMLPKNLGVVWPEPLAAALSLPLSIAARALDPIAPIFRGVNRGSVRLFFPRFAPEPYLELSDLERAIDLTGGNKQLVEQERNVLSRIVALADARIEEIMRPRLLYEAFTPPVKLSQLSQDATGSGYVLITERDSEEIASVIDIDRAVLAGQEDLTPLAAPVLPVPWCASAADTLSRLKSTGRDVAAVLNELGETIGIVTYNDLVGSVLHAEAAREAGSPREERIRAIDDRRWEVTGMTTLRRFGKRLGRHLPEAKGITVAGMLQEQLHALPQEGDEVHWAGLRWRVLRADHPTLLTASVEEELKSDDEGTPK